MPPSISGQAGPVPRTLDSQLIAGVGLIGVRVLRRVVDEGSHVRRRTGDVTNEVGVDIGRDDDLQPVVPSAGGGASGGCRQDEGERQREDGAQSGHCLPLQISTTIFNKRLAAMTWHGIAGLPGSRGSEAQLARRCGEAISSSARRAPQL